MKTKLKSILAAALCAVGLAASALQPSPFRDFWSSTPDPQAVKDPSNVIDWGTASRTFESFDAKHGKFLAGSADAMIEAYTARIEKDPTDCEALICRALAYLKKAGENEAFDRLAKEFGYTFDNDTMHITGELIHEKGVTPEMNDASDEVCGILLPLLKSAYLDLCAIPKNWKGSVAITPDVYPVDEAAYFDYADSLGARAALAELMCVLNMVKGFDVAMDSDKLEDTFNAINQSNGKRGVQALFENNPEFFSKVRDQEALTEAGDWWASAATLLDQWDKAHCRRSDDNLHFFDWNYYKLDSNGTYGLEWCRRQSAELANLPYWASPLNYTKINGEEEQFTSFKPLFGGKVLRANLPEFGVGVKAPYCNEPLIDTCPDSTICGMWPSVSPIYLATYISTRWTDIPPYTTNTTASVYGVWYKNMFDLGFNNEGNPLWFAWDNGSPIELLDPEFNVRGVTAQFKGWSGVMRNFKKETTWEGSEIPTPIKEPAKYVDRRVELTAHFDIPKVTYLDFDETAGKWVELTNECEIVTENTTTLTTGKVYAVAGDVTLNRIKVLSTTESPAKLVLCDGATLAATNGIEVAAGNALTLCGQALGTGTLEATGSEGAAGIGGGGDVTINGGTVMATGGSSSAGINGTVTINSGTVTASGSDGFAGIGGTVKFGAGTAYGVAAGKAETNALYMTAAAYAADSSAAYVALPYFSLKIPEAGENYTYEVSYEGAQPNAVLADGTNTYAIAAGATVRVRFTPDRGYMLDESFDNPMIIADLSEDTVIDAADLPTVEPAPAGYWNNPWEIGSPVAADVVAYTNWVDGKLTLVVEGKGEMMDFKFPSLPPWDDFGESIQSVKVGWGVTKLGKTAFAHFTNLSEASLPEGLRDIGEKAFYCCSDALAEVTIPSTVTSIGESAFYNCRQIQSLTVPGSVRTIGKNAFAGCTSLTSVTMESPVPPTAGADPFAGHNPDLKIKVPPFEYDLYVAAPVWKNYADLFIKPILSESDEFAVDLRTSVNLAGGATTVSNVAWSATQWGKDRASTSTEIGWMNLDTQANGTLADLKGEDADNFALPKKDGEYRLTHSAGGLMSFVYFKVSGTGAKVGSITNPWMVGGKPGDTVAAYETEDGELVIGGKGEMGDQFVENPPWTKGKITSLTIGRDVKSIPDYAFFGYDSLSNVTFATGAQLESIGSHAFAACPNMEELEIPANVTNCGPAVIAGTPNVTVSADNETFAIVDGVLCDVKSNKVISGLDAAVVTIPEGMVEIVECAFSTNGALTSVTIPATMMAIGEDAFKGCANLTEVFVRAEDPPTLLDEAFEGCNAGLTIYVPAGKGETYKYATGWSDYADKIVEMTGAGSKATPWKVGATADDSVVAYTNAEGTLVIEGFGEMMDFTTTNAPWAASAKDIKAIEVAKGVTKIGNAAFDSLDYAGTTTALTFQGEDHVLNLLAFVSADGSKTNAPEAKAFSVYKDSSGTVEPIVAFQTLDQVWVYTKAPTLMRKGYDEVLLLTLPDLKATQTAELIESAGEQPYSKTVQGLLDEALDKIDKATNYGEVTDGYVERLNQIVAQAEKDKSHEIEGTDITWRVLDGMLVIEGEGEMPDFVAPVFTNGAPWDAYKQDIKGATVAAEVSPLGAAAFAVCPAGSSKTMAFEDPKAEIKLAAFVSADGSVTNDFTAGQFWLLDADGDAAPAVKFLADTDPDAPRYDSIAEAIAKDEVSSVTAYTLDGLKELAETWISKEAGPQPWTERVAAAVTNAVNAIEGAADAESVRQAGIGGLNEIRTAQGDDDQDGDLHGTIPGSDVTWKLVGGQLVIEGSGAMPEVLTPAPWSKSIGEIGTVVVGEGVTGLSKGLFTSDLTAPADTVIFGSKTATVPLDAFVGADGSANEAVAVLFATETDGVNEAPSAWTDANDKTKTYGSYAEALADGATAVKPVFTAASGAVEEQIEKAPAAIVEKVQPVDEAGRFIWDPNGDLIDVVTVVENVNTNGVETSERIVVSAVDGLAGVAQAEASESGCTVVTLTVDAQPSDPANLTQERMTWEMTDGDGFEAEFAEITLATNDVPVAEAKSVIEIHIPYVTKGRENFSVTRMHDGKVETFAEIGAPAGTPEDLTFFVGEGEVVIWSLRFSLYAIGSTAIPGCIVNYDGMGAFGEMARDTFLPGIPTNLTANAFTAFGYEFQGWTTNGAAGKVVFKDKARIANPQLGEVYNLQAVWKLTPVTVGNGVTAYLDENGVLHIKGKGAMKDFTDKDPAPWAEFAPGIKAIEVEEGVTKLGNAAFAALDYETTTTTLTFQDEDHVLNPYAFVSADGSVTNAPAVAAFKVFKSASGTAETVAAFYSEESLDFTDTIPLALSKGEDSLQLATLEDVKDAFREDFIETAGEKPYSTAMQDLLGQALQELDEAKSIYEIAAVAGKYIEPLEKQAEKDRTNAIEGTKITWRVMDGTLYISGEGEMPDFVEPDYPDGAPWNWLEADITNVTVAAGITSVGDAAFAVCPSVEGASVLFKDPEIELNLGAFVSGDGSATNVPTVKVEIVTEDGRTLRVAPGGWTNADDPNVTYDSLAEAFEDGATTVVAAFTKMTDEGEKTVPPVEVEEIVKTVPDPADPEKEIELTATYKNNPSDSGATAGLVSEIENLPLIVDLMGSNITVVVTAADKADVPGAVVAEMDDATKAACDAVKADIAPDVQTIGFTSSYLDISAFFSFKAENGPLFEFTKSVIAHIPMKLYDGQIYSVSRRHQDVTEVLPLWYEGIDDGDTAEWVKVDVANQELVVKTRKFCDYALGELELEKSCRITVGDDWKVMGWTDPSSLATNFQVRLTGAVNLSDFAGYAKRAKGEDIGDYAINFVCTKMPKGYGGKFDVIPGTFKILMGDKLPAEGTVRYPSAYKASGCDIGLLREKFSASWTATAAKGSVFAGWVAADGAPECVTTNHLAKLSENERRNKTLSFKVAAGEQIAPTDVAATWARIDEDLIESVDIDTNGLYVVTKSYVTATVSGLPNGLKFNAKTLAITGTVKANDKTYKVKVSVKNASGYTWKQTFGFVVAGNVVTAVVPADDCVTTGVAVMLRCDPAMGKVSGTGVYTLGKNGTKNVSILATAKSGYVFAGWYLDPGFSEPAYGLMVPGSNRDYRQASQTIVVTGPTYLFARFVEKTTKADPITHLRFLGAGYCGADASEFAETETWYQGVALPTNCTIAFGSASLPTVTVSGLPAGVKIDKYSRCFTGVPTTCSTAKKPFFTVKVTVKNKSGATDVLTKYVKVEPLPTWAVGNFDGYHMENGATNGTFTATVAKTGKVSGKTAGGPASTTFSANSFASVKLVAGALCYVADVTVSYRDPETKKTVKASDTLYLMENPGTGLGMIGGGDKDGCGVVGVQRAWDRKDLALPAFVTGKNAPTLALDNGIALKFGANGKVTIAGKVTGDNGNPVTVSGSTYVLPFAWQDATTLRTQVYVYVASRKNLADGVSEVYDVYLTVDDASGKFAAASFVPPTPDPEP